MKKNTIIKPLAIPGMILLIIFILALAVITTHTWNLLSKYKIINLLFI